jgi:restriction endonuclease S subunit
MVTTAKQKIRGCLTPFHFYEKPWFIPNLLHKQIFGITKGVAQFNVSLGRFGSIGLPLPPMADQHHVATEVDRRLPLLRKTEAHVDADLQRAERLRQSILANSFAGKLVKEYQRATQIHRLALQG